MSESRGRRPCCEDTPLGTRLKKGKRAKVIASDGVNVRSAPDLEATDIGGLGTGTRVRIQDGPACADKIVWWRIRYEDRNAWIAEGWQEQGGFFLEPIG